MRSEKMLANEQQDQVEHGIGRVAQRIEHQPSKLGVAGSSPAAPAILEVQRSLSVNRRVPIMGEPELHPVDAGGMRRRGWASNSIWGRSAGLHTR